MNDPTPPSDSVFLTNQRQRLLADRSSLSKSLSRQRMEQQNDQLLIATLLKQRDTIERALAKIDEGTYGLSDVGGDVIPNARLEAFPEAIRTV